MVNFAKQESELQSDLESWLFVLKNMSGLDKIPVYLRKPIFEKLFDIAEYSKLSKEEKDMYDTSLKRKWDNKAVLDHAKEEGRKEGKQKVVKNLILELSLTNEQTARIAEVSVAFVEKVRNSLNKNK